MSTTTVYRIKIEKIVKGPGVKREYEQLRKPYPFEEKLSDWLSDEQKKKRDADPQYGYVEKPSEYSETTAILDQTSDTIDLIAVIKAVNGIT